MLVVFASISVVVVAVPFRSLQETRKLGTYLVLQAPKYYILVAKGVWHSVGSGWSQREEGEGHSTETEKGLHGDSYLSTSTHVSQC